MTKPEIWYTRWLHSKPEEDGEDFAVIKFEDYEKILQSLRQQIEKIAIEAFEDVMKAEEKGD